ncbi:membrane-bound lytic murein transglycosylase D [Methylohalomonas lacus]|uniref:Membrane-bound lytic murein transglycosylase D n=1 Tax=Methylohalomonas lacus TaxID=398773 RepID=A0AAE3HM62_9GAMM|nr:LysM peptidoglycan-binding domain-containing protein [Methylohalomonas lacus]MCS3903517.1 membrane-bound lytic murein transglycosylase D [Methylohalomonas lacus]
MKRLTTITILLFLCACSSNPSQKTASSDPSADDQAVADAEAAGNQHEMRVRPVRPDLMPSNQWGVDSPLPEADEAASHDDVWARIRAGLTLDRHTNQPAVQRKLEWYKKHADYMSRVAERAAPYIHHIVEELDARGMPLDLALLPVIESAYKPRAYSRSHAAGLWQFIPATGERFGLKQNWWYDGRRDVTAATSAALDYLQFLNTEMSGDWLHALAGYNAGENTVLRAIRRNANRNRPTDFWHLSLPNETRGYVPALLATVEVIANPEQYGVNLKPVANEPYFTQVATGGQLDLSKAAELAGISEAEMKRLNPAFRRWATDPDGPHGLLLPVDKAEKFEQALNRLPASDRITWRRHEIRRGETLGQIANRYDTTVAVLQRTNQLRGNLIRAGKQLLIPAPGQENSAPPAELAQAGTNESAAENKQHTVRRGENLWNIARRYNHKVATLTQVNNLTSDSVLQPGQRLRIPANGDSGRSDDGSQATGRKQVRYTVRQGDSLWSISRRFQVSVAALREWNSLQSQALLKPGQELELYVDQGI